MQEVTPWIGNKAGRYRIIAQHRVFLRYAGGIVNLPENEHFSHVQTAVEMALRERGYKGEFDRDLITVALEHGPGVRFAIIFTDGGSGEALLRLIPVRAA